MNSAGTEIGPMKKIIFVCHGNICRSPMAEFIMKQKIEDTGKAEEFNISSAAVSYEEEGNDMYPPAKAKLRQHGICFTAHRAHRITRAEFEEADLVIVMDNSNIRLLERIAGPSDKVHKMMEYAGSLRDVADPWYTGDFEATYQDLDKACQELLKKI